MSVFWLRMGFKRRLSFTGWRLVLGLGQGAYWERLVCSNRLDLTTFGATISRLLGRLSHDSGTVFCCQLSTLPSQHATCHVNTALAVNISLMPLRQSRALVHWPRCTKIDLAGESVVGKKHLSPARASPLPPIRPPASGGPLSTLLTALRHVIRLGEGSSTSKAVLVVGDGSQH